MDGMFWIVAAMLVAVFEWGLTLGFAYQWFDGNMGLGRLFAAVLIVMPASYALEAYGNFAVWQAEIAQKYAHFDMPDLFEQGRILEYIGEMLGSQFGMPVVVAAVVFNFLIWLFWNHGYRLLSLLSREDDKK